MAFVVKKTSKIEEVADFVATSILNKLNSDKKVLFFVTGGSSVAVAVEVAKNLQKDSNKNLKNLTVTLTDERYGPVDHFNSNYFKLKEKGFNLPEAKVIPILADDDLNITTQKFNEVLKEEFEKAEYKIGLFGVGADGHTAGILPESEATHSENLVCNYGTPVFLRITMTFKAIEKLDEVIVFTQGEEKMSIIKSLEKNIDVIKQPAQILKKVPLLTIFTLSII